MVSPAPPPDDELTLSLPSLAFVAVLTIFAIRWFWTSRSSTASGTTSSRSQRQINPEHVEQISQMFPQLSRRDIMWDLRRNGGSVTATTERILQGRGLERVSTFAWVFPSMRSGIERFIPRKHLLTYACYCSLRQVSNQKYLRHRPHHTQLRRPAHPRQRILTLSRDTTCSRV